MIHALVSPYPFATPLRQIFHIIRPAFDAAPSLARLCFILLMQRVKEDA